MPIVKNVLFCSVIMLYWIMRFGVNFNEIIHILYYMNLFNSWRYIMIVCKTEISYDGQGIYFIVEKKC